VHEFAWDDFARTTDLVAAGEQAALEALPRIKAILEPAAAVDAAQLQSNKSTGPS
jgi:hypothetical protein